MFSGFLFSMLLAATSFGQTFYGTTDLKTFLDGRDAEFRNEEKSPLTTEDFPRFKGLSYFDMDKQFRVQAKFMRTADEKYFQMPSSSGIATKFVKYGLLSFRLLGADQTLNVYQVGPDVRAKYPEYADLLFIPFRDQTSGLESYSVGRYIDIKIPSGETLTIDFNLAYNPNCAYGRDDYSCPIPPKENFLKVAIRAGEKTFKHPST